MGLLSTPRPRPLCIALLFSKVFLAQREYRLKMSAARRRLSRFWNEALCANGAYRGWGTELPVLDFAVRKDGLAHIGALGRLHQSGGGKSATGPKAWVLPHSSGAWHAKALSPERPAGDLWIFKPATASCGVGVVVGSADVVASHLRDTATGQLPGVVQEYEARPRLIGGLKFDLRCYAVCVAEARSSRLHVYLYLDGLARFATRRYGSGGDAGDAGGGGAVEAVVAAQLPHDQHLTNYSVNQQAGGLGEGWLAALLGGGAAPGAGAGFLESADASGGGGLDASGKVLAHKWSAASALSFMAAEREGPSWATVGDLLAQAVADVLRAPVARRSLASTLVPAAPPTEKRRFELIGVDVLFDADDCAHLIELQRRPDLSPTSALDFRVKSTLLAGVDALLTRHGGGSGSAGSDDFGSEAAAVPGDGGVPEGWMKLELPACEFDKQGPSARWDEWQRVDDAICQAMQDDRDAWAAADTVWHSRDDGTRWLYD